MLGEPSVRSFVTVRTMSGAPAASESRRRNPACAAAPARSAEKTSERSTMRA